MVGGGCMGDKEGVSLCKWWIVRGLIMWLLIGLFGNGCILQCSWIPEERFFIMKMMHSVSAQQLLVPFADSTEPLVVKQYLNPSCKILELAWSCSISPMHMDQSHDPNSVTYMIFYLSFWMYHLEENNSTLYLIIPSPVSCAAQFAGIWQ